MKRFLAFTITIKEDEQGKPVCPVEDFHKLLESVGFYDFKSPYLNEGSEVQINGVYEYEHECPTIGFNVFWFRRFLRSFLSCPIDLYITKDKVVYGIQNPTLLRDITIQSQDIITIKLVGIK